MAIKIIQHKQTPKELAYHFKCNCGCEFWSDSEGVLSAKSLDVILFYQTHVQNAAVVQRATMNRFCEKKFLTIKMYVLKCGERNGSLGTKSSA